MFAILAYINFAVVVRIMWRENTVALYGGKESAWLQASR